MNVAIDDNGIECRADGRKGGGLHHAIHWQHGKEIDQEHKTPEQPLQLHGARLAGKYLHN